MTVLLPILLSLSWAVENIETLTAREGMHFGSELIFPSILAQHGSRFARLLNSKHSNSNYHFFYLNKCFLIYGAIEITVQPRPFHRTAVLVLRQRLRTLEGLSSACQSAAPSTTSSFLLQVKAPKSSRF